MTKEIFYNVTFNVDEAIESDWANWMNSDFIPWVLSLDYFFEARLLSILVEEEMGGKSFALMLKSKSLEQIEAFSHEKLNNFNSKINSRYGNKVLTFMTLLQEEGFYKRQN